jgi:hypothetical protein
LTRRDCLQFEGSANLRKQDLQRRWYIERPNVGAIRDRL